MTVEERALQEEVLASSVRFVRFFSLVHTETETLFCCAALS